MRGVLTFFFLFGFVFAQWQDDFIDGNFTSNPTWFGDVDSFEIATDTLHLNAPANTQESYLSTFSESSVDGFWEFDIFLDFNPSSGNKAYIYLMSDESNLKADINGYYVLIGNTNDEVSLFRQDGATSTKIIDGIDDLLDASTVACRVKVTRDAIGNWELFADTSQSFNNYQSQGVNFDDTYLSSSYFGVKCDYTASRSDKFYFDNFLATAIPYVDNTPPQLLSFDIVNLQSIDLHFSEILDSLSVSNLQHYNLSTIGSPQEVVLINNTAKLTFQEEIQGNIPYNLSIQNILDTTGNELDTLVSFEIDDAYPAQAFIFNEIYADETPSYGLPDAEYIEIYNTTIDTFFTAGCLLVIENDTAFFPVDTILPDTYALLTKSTTAPLFQAYGKTLGLTGFPALSNSEDTIELYNRYHQLIDRVAYSDEWYRNIATSNGEMKEDGGFSLERIALQNPCEDFYNWFPSEAVLGGTPAQENSVTNQSFEQEIAISSVVAIAEDTIQLTFTSNFQWQEAAFSISYFVDDMGLLIFPDTVLSFSQNQVNLVLDENVVQGVEYFLLVENVLDCYGNILENLSADFYLPQALEEGDLIINEILFNPKSGESDFIEIYNRSEKTVDILGLKIEKRAVFEMDSVLDFEEIEQNILMPPHSFFTFTKDSLSILNSFSVENSEWLYEVDLPNFDDKEDVVVLRTDSLYFDELHYYERWHYDLIDDENGVSLERIRYDEPLQNNDNWTSAASSFGFGTPTAVNSQHFESYQEAEISISPEVFTPNQDGDKDFALISCQLDQGGFVANVTIFDVTGRPITALAMSEYLGTSGQWIWDGSNQNGEKVAVGIYIVLIELFDLNGKKKSYKKQVVLGARL